MHWPNLPGKIKRLLQVIIQKNPDIEPQVLEKVTGDYVFNPVKGTVNFSVTEPLDVLEIGTGFMMVKREVFETLKDKVPSYTNDMYHAVDTVREVKIIPEFFATSIDEESNRLLSEDYHFCKIAREAGFKVYAAPWATFGHTGTYTFSGQLPRSA